MDLGEAMIRLEEFDSYGIQNKNLFIPPFVFPVTVID